MTQQSIDETVQAIRKSTLEASKSKESAMAFLVAAGIFKGAEPLDDFAQGVLNETFAESIIATPTLAGRK
jgi:hypothetical protein